METSFLLCTLVICNHNPPTHPRQGMQGIVYSIVPTIWGNRQGCDVYRKTLLRVTVYLENCWQDYLKETLKSNEPRDDKTNKMSVRSAKTRISLGIHLVWSESLLSAWRKLGFLATHWMHSEDCSDWVDAQSDLSLCWAHSRFVGFVMSRLKLMLKYRYLLTNDLWKGTRSDDPKLSHLGWLSPLSLLVNDHISIILLLPVKLDSLYGCI